MTSEKQKKESSTIMIKKTTIARLSDIGKHSDTYDDIVNRLIDFYLEHDAR